MGAFDQFNRFSNIQTEDDLNSYVKDYGNPGGSWGDTLNQKAAGFADAKKQQQERETAVNDRKGNLVNSYTDQARKQLSQSIVQNTQNAASRGLLHSGLKQGADQNSRSQAAGNVAGYQAQVNRASDQDLGSMELDAANEGLNRYQANANTAAQTYQNELNKQGQKQGVMGSLGSAIGTIGGGLLGKSAVS